MNLNLGNNFRAAFAVVATAGAADAVIGCSLNHPISGWNTDAASDVADGPDTVVVDVPNDRKVLDVILDGQPLDRPPPTDINADTSPDAPEVMIIPDAAFIDMPDAAADVFPEDAGEDVVDATVIEAAVDAETPPDVTEPVDAADVSRVDATPEDRPAPADAGAETGVVDAGVDAVADRVVVDTPTADAAPDAIPADSGPRYTRPATTQFYLTFDEPGTAINTYHTTSILPFGTRMGGSADTEALIGSSASLVNTGDAIVASSNTFGNFSGDFGMGAWVRLNTGATAARTVFARRGSYALTIDSSTGGLSFTYNDGSCSMNSGTTSVPNSTWTHVALTLRGSMASLWINGTRVGTNSSCSVIPSSTNPLYIGGAQTSTAPNRPLVGSIDQAYAWTSSTSDQNDVRNLMCADQLAAGVSLALFCP